MTLTVRDLDARALRDRLSSKQGLRLRTGPFSSSVRTRIQPVVASIGALYADYEVVPESEFIDFEVEIRLRPGLRRWWKPQVEFILEGHSPFNPLAGDQGFPMLEWGLNWCVYAQCHQYLILHAAVLERGGRALILPGASGSGKSTLCAGLLFHGWRLLSDELTLIEPATGFIAAMPRPVSLKNESIAVISELSPGLQFGSRISETVKGTVAHFAAPAEAVRRAAESAAPGWVVMPRYVSGSGSKLQPIARAECFMELIENAFNYDVFGAEGFELLGTLLDSSRCFRFEYGDLREAMRIIGRLPDEAAG